MVPGFNTKLEDYILGRYKKVTRSTTEIGLVTYDYDLMFIYTI